MHHTRNYQGVLVLMCYTKIAYEQSEVKMSELKKIKNRFKPAHFHKQLYTYILYVSSHSLSLYNIYITFVIM